MLPRSQDSATQCDRKHGKLCPASGNKVGIELGGQRMLASKSPGTVFPSSPVQLFSLQPLNADNYRKLPRINHQLSQEFKCSPSNTSVLTWSRFCSHIPTRLHLSSNSENTNPFLCAQ